MGQDKDAPARIKDEANGLIDGDKLLSGIWHSKYRYPSSSRHGMFEGEHFVRLRRSGKHWVFESLPNRSKSALAVRLTLEDRVAIGTWQERTSPEGYYKGAVYHGAIQMILDEDGRQLRGKWLGHGKDMEVNVGNWELTFVGSRLPKNGDNGRSD